MELSIYFKHRLFPLLQTDRTIQRSLYCIRVAVIILNWSKLFVTHRQKLEEVDIVHEEFQHKKINNKDFCMWIMVYYRGYSRRCMYLRQSRLFGVRHYRDLTTLNWSRWLKYYSFFLRVQQQASFNFFILFSSWFWCSCRFGFSFFIPIFQLLQLALVRFSK